MDRHKAVAAAAVFMVAATALLAVTDATQLRAQPFGFLGWGVQAGIGAGYVDYAGGITGLDPGWGMGFSINPFAEFSLAGAARLQAGLRLGRFKNHSEVNRDRGEGWGEIVLDYVSVPVFAKLVFPSRPRLFVAAGPELAFIWSAESRTGINGVEDHYDLSSGVERFNLTLDAGFGIEFDAGGRTIVVQGLYCHGLLSLAKEGYWLADWETREITLTAGILF